ncbi:MAG: hypothetical protein ACHQQR_09295, partial [Gemmatimonadales bacterium]
MSMIDHKHVGAKRRPCERCGKAAKRHRDRVEHAYAGRAKKCGKCGKPRKAHRDRKDRQRERWIVGIDGEGLDACSKCGKGWPTRRDGSPADVCPCGGTHRVHRYTFLAAVREDGQVVAEKYNRRGLTHDECVSVILAIPDRSLVFSFMGSYDATKIMEGVAPDDEPESEEGLTKFMLFHPEARRRYRCKNCGHGWSHKRLRCKRCGSSRYRTTTPHYDFNGRGYAIDGGGFTVATGRKTKLVQRPGSRFAKSGKHEPLIRRVVKWEHSTRVWDAFGFTRRSFVESLKAFEVGTEEERAEISLMKGKRGRFAHVDPERIKSYCRAECALLARMMRRMLDIFEQLGLDLKGQYRGAGSIAGALMRKHEVDECRGPSQRELHEGEPDLARAIMSAYFSGRQEITRSGMI